MKNPAHIVNPSNTLKSQRFFAKRIYTHGRYTVLDSLLEDIRLGYLDEGRMDGRRVRDGRFILLFGVHDAF